MAQTLVEECPYLGVAPADWPADRVLLHRVVPERREPLCPITHRAAQARDAEPIVA